MRLVPRAAAGVRGGSPRWSTASAPDVGAGEIDVLPAQRRYVFEHLGGNGAPLTAEVIHSASEIDRIPVNNGAHDQVQPRCPEGLALERAIPDFAALVEVHGPFQLVGCLALIQTSLTTPPEWRIGIPLDH